jgi:hypothetical protein
VSATVASKPAQPKPLVPVKKYWGKSKPVRQVMGLVFVLYGWLRLGSDLAAVREPFFIADLREWSTWLGARWNDLFGAVDGFGGVDVVVND